MSQMKPYCFKCGAELDPEAIYCPECGRLQRSMVVRAVDPAAPSAPPAAPRSDGPHEQPLQFYPDREAPPEQPAAPPDQASYYPDSSWQHPDQHDPYAQQQQQQYADQGWQAEGEAGQADAYGQDAWSAQPGDEQVYAQHADPDPQQQPPQEQEQPWISAGYEPYTQPEAQTPYGEPEQPAAGHQDTWREAAPATYGQPESSWEQTDAAYGQTEAGYGHQEPAYGEPDPGYGHTDPANGQVDPAHGQQEPAYGLPDPSYARAEPVQEPDYGDVQAAAPTDPWAPRPVSPPVPPLPPPAPPMPPPGSPGSYRPGAPSGRYEPDYSPPEPIYSSSSPAAPSSAGGYQPYSSAQPSRYTPAAANPYSPPYRPTENEQAQGSNTLRLVALAVAALLGLFLIGLGIGHLLGVMNGSGTPSAAAPPATTRPSGPPTAAPSHAPTTAPTATPVPTPTTGTVITGNAKFQRVNTSIPGRCTTSQGCPIQVTLKNNGGQGSGSVTVTLSDAASGGNTLATFTGPIPVTDAGATVQVTGFAQGDQLPAYLRSGGTVYITGTDIQNGG